MQKFTPKLDTLPSSQREIWPLLEPAQRQGLVLYGGTALALRLGHRISLDFDFFSNLPLDQQGLISALPFLKKAELICQEKNTLTFLTDNRVKLSFFGGINFGRVGLVE
ncbi:MAG: nucleotidyl transferase AbiEii/AbiGii toxin family protein, partial [Desulfovibrio sp.]|nr:nucleotidyl transferase AbiEii/AbiGii toxin family protein [Desulfovibrio sp.]